MKKIFSYFWQSISSFDFYKKALTFRMAEVFKYLVLLLLVFSLLISGGVTFRMTKVFGDLADWAIKNLPAIDITDGKVSVDAQMPFKIREKGMELILDTTGQTTFISEETEQGILLTKDKLIYKQSKNQINTYELSNVKKLSLNRTSIENWKRISLRIFFPLCFAAVFIYYVIAKTLQLLFFSLLPLAVCGIRNIKLRYSEIFKITVFALTLPFFIASILEVFLFKVMFFPIVFTVIYTVYLTKASLVCWKINKSTQGVSLGT